MKNIIKLLVMILLISLVSTFVACGEPKTFKVTFDSQEGTVVEEQVVESGQVATKPIDPTREGYIFKGWLNENIDFKFDTPIKSDITLKANWEGVPCVVTFDMLEGEDIVRNLKYGDKIEEPVHTNKPGYTLGWDVAISQIVTKTIKYTETCSANNNTKYIVKHLQQNLSGDDYVEVETDRQNLTGTTDTNTSVESKNYKGFVAQSFDQKKISGDGTTVVEVKYDREMYTLNIVKGEGVSVKVEDTEVEKISGIPYGMLFTNLENVVVSKEGFTLIFFEKSTDNINWVHIKNDDFVESSINIRPLFIKQLPKSSITGTAIEFSTNVLFPAIDKYNVEITINENTLTENSFTPNEVGYIDVVQNVKFENLTIVKLEKSIYIRGNEFVIDFEPCEGYEKHLGEGEPYPYTNTNISDLKAHSGKYSMACPEAQINWPGYYQYNVKISETSKKYSKFSFWAYTDQEEVSIQIYLYANTVGGGFYLLETKLTAGNWTQYTLDIKDGPQEFDTLTGFTILADKTSDIFIDDIAAIPS